MDLPETVSVPLQFTIIIMSVSIVVVTLGTIGWALATYVHWIACVIFIPFAIFALFYSVGVIVTFIERWFE